MQALQASIRALVVAVSAAAVAGGVATHATAATQVVAGTNVDFIYDDALLGLFGPPTVAGNSIFFTPTNFFAQSLDGAGTRTARSTINVRIRPRDGWQMDAVALTERGDYLLAGAGSEVGVRGQVRVFDVANFLNEVTAPIATVGALNINDGANHNWIANAFADLSNPSFDSAREFNFTLENILRAITLPGVVPSEAFIEKKFAGGAIVITAIPEPSAVAMILAGLGVVGLLVRRRRESGV